MLLGICFPFLDDQLDGFFLGDAQGIMLFAQRNKLAIMPDIWAESPNGSHYLFILKHAHIPGKRKQLQSIFQGNTFDKLPSGQAGKLLFLILLGTNLYQGSKYSEAGNGGLTGFGIDTEFLGGIDIRTVDALGLFDFGMEAAVEILDHLLPLLRALGNLVKFLFYLGG